MYWRSSDINRMGRNITIFTISHKIYSNQGLPVTSAVVRVGYFDRRVNLRIYSGLLILIRPCGCIWLRDVSCERILHIHSSEIILTIPRGHTKYHCREHNPSVS